MIQKVQEHNAANLSLTDSVHEEFEIGELDDADIGLDTRTKVEENKSDSSCSSKAVAADEKSVGALSTTPVDNGSESNEFNVCSICLEHFAVGEEVSWSRNIDCNHVFHRACIQQWLMKAHDDCPVCRNDYVYDEWDLPPALPPPIPRKLFWRRPSKFMCTCPEAKSKDKRSECVFCITHGLECPDDEGTHQQEECKDVERCEIPPIKEDTCKDSVDLEVGQITGQPCPVHGARPCRGRSSQRRRNRHQHEEATSLSSYDAAMRDSWWNLSNHYIGYRSPESYPSWAARSQFN